jgi:hypothetical protein
MDEKRNANPDVCGLFQVDSLMRDNQIDAMPVCVRAESRNHL